MQRLDMYANIKYVLYLSAAELLQILSVPKAKLYNQKNFECGKEKGREL